MNIRHDIASLLLMGLGLLWLIPLFTGLHQQYPPIGSLLFPTIIVMGVFAAPTAALASLTKEPHRLASSKVGVAIVVALVSVANASIWTPCLNGLLALHGKVDIIPGEVIRLEGRGRSGVTRSVFVVLKGRRHFADFDPTQFWSVPAVREGGPIWVRVRGGFFGVPWIDGFIQPEEERLSGQRTAP